MATANRDTAVAEKIFERHETHELANVSQHIKRNLIGLCDLKPKKSKK